MRVLEKNFYNTLSDLFWKAYGLKGEGILSRASNHIKTPIPQSVICSFATRRKHKSAPSRPTRRRLALESDLGSK